MTEAEFRAAFDRLTPHGWLSEPEARLLVKAAEETTGDIVEIGSYMGRSAMLLACLGRTLWCVDPWADGFHSELTGDQVYGRFIVNVSRLPPAALKLVKTCRMGIENWLPVPAGIVYCDGDHSYQGTRNQIFKAKACAPTRIAVHDVNDDGEGAEIKRACLELLGPWHERVERLAVWRL